MTFRVWRRTGERHTYAWFVERDPLGGPDILVWDGIRIKRRVGYALFHLPNYWLRQDNSVTALSLHWPSHEASHHNIFRHQNHLFQQDNARPHISDSSIKTSKAYRPLVESTNIGISGKFAMYCVFVCACYVYVHVCVRVECSSRFV